MHRCAGEELIAVQSFLERMQARPAAGIILATAELDPKDASVLVQVSDVGCTPLCLVSVASELLAAAAEMMDSLTEGREIAADLIEAVAQAREALSVQSDVEHLQ